MANRDNKRSLRQKIQDFMSTPKGQTIMNYAYNWGASVVIMGTLFKLTHLPGADPKIWKNWLTLSPSSSPEIEFNFVKATFTNLEIGRAHV